MEVVKKCLLYLSVVIGIMSCDIKLINTDIELTGTPCYFSDEFAQLYYRFDDKTSIGIGSGGIVYEIFWNDSIIIQKNDTMKYDIIRLIPQPKKGVPWTYTGYISKEDFDKYSIDVSEMRHIDLSDYGRWAEIKKYMELNSKIKSDDLNIDSIHYGQELNKRLKQSGQDTMVNPYYNQ